MIYVWRLHFVSGNDIIKQDKTFPVTILLRGETMTKKPAGRPRLHIDDKARVRAYRKQQRHQGRRLDVYVGVQASWRLKRLADAWECGLGEVINRLVLEADDRYSDVLFPETE